MDITKIQLMSNVQIAESKYSNFSKKAVWYEILIVIN